MQFLVGSARQCASLAPRSLAVREFATRPGVTIGRRILDSFRRAKETLQTSSPSTSSSQRSLTDALSDLEKAVTNPELPPTILESNREMLRKLQGFCLRLSYAHAFPPKSTLRVQFAVKKPTGMEYARGLLRTTGSDCAENVHAELAGLFAKSGVDPQFAFLDNEFEGGRQAFLHAMYRKSKGLPARRGPLQQQPPSSGGPEPAGDDQVGSMGALPVEDDKMRADATAEKQAAAMRWAARMKAMDPLFSALAAVPWVSDIDSEKARHVQTTVLDTLEGDGWDVRGPVMRLWAGQRDYQKLRAGLDPGSSDAIKAILMHAQRYDEQYGSKTYRPSQGGAA